MFCSKCGVPVFTETKKETEEERLYDKEADEYDIASYVLSTGKDYETNTVTEKAKADRAAFVEQFPEYTSSSFWQLQFIPASVKKEILDWYFER